MISFFQPVDHVMRDILSVELALDFLVINLFDESNYLYSFF